MGQDPRPQGSWIPLESGVCLGEQTRSQVTVIKCQVIISDRRVTSLGPAPVDATPCGHSLPSHCLPLSLVPRGEKTNFLILPHQLSFPGTNTEQSKLPHVKLHFIQFWQGAPPSLMQFERGALPTSESNYEISCTALRFLKGSSDRVFSLHMACAVSLETRMLQTHSTVNTM